MTAKYVSYTFAPRTLLGTRTLLGSRRAPSTPLPAPRSLRYERHTPAVTNVVEVARQRKEEADLARATGASLAEARASGRKRDREEGTGSSR